MIAGRQHPVIVLRPFTCLLVRELAHRKQGVISAACGYVLTAALVMSMLFEGWPAARLLPAAGPILTSALPALTAFALERALAAYVGSAPWTRATPNEWITTAALSYDGAAIILHVDMGFRWPSALASGALSSDELPGAGRFRAPGA
ncbi:hypothetical protein [Paractinoplanes maris]|uniref:hypothetical protein n=1 Tax=Paractinoplanes maris TaxID=1734446 RepID=UPI0020223BA9|nr:hypothetical protein [Actinoplanes maris]